jgi:hypothetical protein
MGRPAADFGRWMIMVDSYYVMSDFLGDKGTNKN